MIVKETFYAFCFKRNLVSTCNFLFVLGLVGLALPVIPQVPFFLLSIYFTSKFSPRFHNWISNNRLYKEYLLPLKNAIKSEKKLSKINLNKFGIKY
ncbi:DUF454 family protein [Ligilactobacillus salivarius]